MVITELGRIVLPHSSNVSRRLNNVCTLSDNIVGCQETREVSNNSCIATSVATTVTWCSMR